MDIKRYFASNKTTFAYELGKLSVCTVYTRTVQVVFTVLFSGLARVVVGPNSTTNLISSWNPLKPEDESRVQLKN